MSACREGRQVPEQLHLAAEEKCAQLMEQLLERWECLACLRFLGGLSEGLLPAARQEWAAERRLCCLRRCRAERAQQEDGRCETIGEAVDSILAGMPEVGCAANAAACLPHRAGSLLCSARLLCCSSHVPLLLTVLTPSSGPCAASHVPPSCTTLLYRSPVPLSCTAPLYCS